MHPYPAFREDSDAKNLNFARNRGFGTLSVNGEPAPEVIHIPFLLSEIGDHVEFHLARFNPIARIGQGHAVLTVTGPNGYVSPDWYNMADQVPTWNYVAVHLRGNLEALPMDSLSGLIDRQSAFFEEKLAPKPPWTAEKMSDGVKDQMMKAIRPFRLSIKVIDGIWKLNQNKPDDVRLRASKKIGEGVGSDLDVLTEWMREA